MGFWCAIPKFGVICPSTLGQYVTCSRWSLFVFSLYLKDLNEMTFHGNNLSSQILQSQATRYRSRVKEECAVSQQPLESPYLNQWPIHLTNHSFVAINWFTPHPVIVANTVLVRECHLILVMIASLGGGGEPNTYTSTNSAWEFHRTFSGGKGKFTARLVIKPVSTTICTSWYDVSPMRYNSWWENEWMIAFKCHFNRFQCHVL